MPATPAITKSSSPSPVKPIGKTKKIRAAEMNETSATAALLRREIDRLEAIIRSSSSAAFDTLSDEHKLQAHLGMLEAKERISVIEPFARTLSKRIKDAARTTAETAALKLTLANMDLEDFVEDRTKRARQELRNASAIALHATSDAWRDLELRLSSIGKEVSKYF